MRNAVARWHPRASSDPDLHVVVATTAPHPDAGAIAEAFDTIVDEQGGASLRSRVSMAVHAWDNIVAIVRELAELANYFIETDEHSDEAKSVELDRLGKCIEASVAGTT